MATTAAAAAPTASHAPPATGGRDRHDRGDRRRGVGRVVDRGSCSATAIASARSARSVGGGASLTASASASLRRAAPRARACRSGRSAIAASSSARSSASRAPTASSASSARSSSSRRGLTHVAPPITVRSRIRPSRMRVFTVPKRDPQLLGDLDVGEAVVEGQLQRLALHVGEPGHRADRPAALLATRPPLSSGVGLGDGRSGADRSLAGAMGLLAAHAVDGPPVGDRDGPRANAAPVAVEARRLPPQLDEDLLGDLLGLRRVAQDAPGHAVHGGRQPVVERGERLPDRHQRPGPSARRARASKDHQGARPTRVCGARHASCARSTGLGRPGSRRIRS